MVFCTKCCEAPKIFQRHSSLQWVTVKLGGASESLGCWSFPSALSSDKHKEPFPDVTLLIKTQTIGVDQTVLVLMPLLAFTSCFHSHIHTHALLPSALTFLQSLLEKPLAFSNSHRHKKKISFPFTYIFFLSMTDTVSKHCISQIPKTNPAGFFFFIIFQGPTPALPLLANLSPLFPNAKPRLSTQCCQHLPSDKKTKLNKTPKSLWLKAFFCGWNLRSNSSYLQSSQQKSVNIWCPFCLQLLHRQAFSSIQATGLIGSRAHWVAPLLTFSRGSQGSGVCCWRWRRRPDPVSSGRRQRGGTGHRPAVPGGHQPFASSASQRACWPRTGGPRPVGHPSPEFSLIGQEKHAQLASGVLDCCLTVLQFNTVKMHFP